MKGRNVIFNLLKKKTGTFWPFLTKEKKKDPLITVLFQYSIFKVDWNKWIDEDEEEKKLDAPWDPDKMEGI